LFTERAQKEPAFVKGKTQEVDLPLHAAEIRRIDADTQEKLARAAEHKARAFAYRAGAILGVMFALSGVAAHATGGGAAEADLAARAVLALAGHGV
jgi:hypothetical protein